MATRASKAVMDEARVELRAAQDFKRILREKYASEEKVPMYLSPMYRAYFGNVMRVTVQGISIYFKVDGTTQLVPQTFADEISRRRMCIDNMLAKQNRMADIPSNYERAPGELSLF